MRHFNYIGNNRKSFEDLMHKEFGRRVIYTDKEFIDETNILEELGKALGHHSINQMAIEYLDNYYLGDQPILYRSKTVRPEINNRVVENHAYELVESKVADLYGEPVQYVLKGIEDENKSEQLMQLNNYLESEDKAQIDIEKGRWQSICGTGYIFVGKDNRMPKDYDEAPFYLKCEHPYDTFVCYYSDDNTPAFSCQIRSDEQGDYYFIYTNAEWFKIRSGGTYGIEDKGVNGNFMIPVIEYPNNERRLSDIEVSITLTDAMNKMQSDRMNGVEQFVQAFMKFKNCEIDKDTFLEMCGLGAIQINTTASGNDADVELMTAQLDQQQTQTAKDDLYENFLIIQGKPSRQEASGGDTGQAVALRNGYYDEDKRAELRVPMFKKSERMLLRVVLNKLRVVRDFDLKIHEIEIKPKRSKLENMMVKAQVLQILHSVGVDDAIALKTINLFSDVQETIAMSTERMEQNFNHANGLDTVETTTVEATDDESVKEMTNEFDKQKNVAEQSNFTM